MTIADCWLMGPFRGRGGQLQLHWLTPIAHGFCDYVAPRGDPAELSDLRDGARSAAVEDRWPAPVVEALRMLVDRSSTPLRIRLAIHAAATDPVAAIARAWQRTAFEGLTLMGRPVTDLAFLERETPTDPAGSCPATGDAVILNTWYPLQTGEPDRVVTRVSPGVTLRMGFLQVCDFLTHEADLRSLAALGIVAHGTCEASVCHQTSEPFLARLDPAHASQEVTWSLPPVTLPPLVVILACSSERLELADYASSLLQRGARCVLVPAGRIDASRGAAFLGDFLQQWRGGKSVVEALAALRTAYRSNLLDRLWILGDGGLRHADAVGEISPDRFSDLHTGQLRQLLAREGSRAAATAALADRATLTSVLAVGSLRSAISILNYSLGVEGQKDYRDEVGRRLQRQLDEAYEHCTLVTRAWLANYLMGLSERYDHAAMRRYRHAPDRDKAASCGVPAVMHFSAVADAREGRFSRSAQSLRRGFEILDDLGEDIAVDRLTLTGTIVNHLIDFNVPLWSTTVVRRMITELDTMEGEEAAWLEFTAADRLARGQLRGGGADEALAAMIRKRTEAIARGERGHRELAWLVYITAWSNRPVTQTQSGWIQEAVQVATTLRGSIGDDPARELAGNDDLTYLIRALAARHWAQPEAALATLLEPWIDAAVSQMEGGKCDPGPWGFILGYLTAAGSTSAGEHWAAARALMLAANYQLEVIGLECLQARRSPDQSDILREFAHLRERVVDILLPILQRPTLLGAAADLGGDLQARAHGERAALDTLPENAAERKATMLASGLVPL